MKRRVNSSQTNKNRLNYESSTNVIEAKKIVDKFIRKHPKLYEALKNDYS